MRQSTRSGLVEYVTDDVGRMGLERFRISVLPDGQRLLRAYCEMHDDDLVRDVFLAVDAEWRPTRAHVHVTLKREPLGSAHYAFTESTASVHLSPSGAAATLESHPLPHPLNGFGSHSVQNDAWFYAAFDRVRGTSDDAELPDMAVCSRLANGGEAPAFHLTTQRHRFHGEEHITVPAGTFATRHYTFCFDQWPPIHYWVHGDDYLLIQCRRDHLRQSYRLIELLDS